MFCLCRYFLYFFIVGAIGSSSNITSFSASAICSVDFAGKILLVGGINPLGGGGGGIPWSDGLVVTRDAVTHVTGSCCMLVAEGWVRLCITVEMGDRKRDKICWAVSSFDRLGFTVPSLYCRGKGFVVYYRQMYLPLGFAWLCERWYRILLIGFLCLSLGCDTWFTISYANAWPAVMTAGYQCKWIQSSSTYCVIGLL